MKTPLRRAATAALCVLLATCRFPTGIELPNGSVPFSPPSVYARWWAMAQSCSGVTGNLGDVAFHQVPGVPSFQHNDDQVLGFWTNDGNRIVLAGDATLNGSAVRHEMLHALIRVGGHPRDQFLGKCAGVVDCFQACVADAGSAPAADPFATVLTPTALQVTVDVTPVTPTSQLDGGFFTVTVNARNPNATPGVAKLGPTNVGAAAFRYDVRGPTGATTGATGVIDASTVTFKPGETKRQVYDFSIGNSFPQRRLPAGVYTVADAVTDAGLCAARRRASARDEVLLTVPTETPSCRATSTSEASK
jgi:hypothetical protein